MRLGIYDTNRLSELIGVYLKPGDNGITIYKNGEVCLDSVNFIKRMLNIRAPGTMDFLDVVKRLSESILEQKQNSPQALSACNEALGVLIATNDRKKVIELLYSAHLIDAERKQKQNFQQNNRQAKLSSVEVIDRVKPKNVTVFSQTNRRNDQNGLADLLNSADEVYICEEE